MPEAATTPPLWYVLDPQDNLDTSDTLPAVDDRGNRHVVYDANREGIGATYQLRYARTAPVVTESAADQRAATDTAGARKLVPVHGDPIPVLAGSVQTGMVQATSAVDPATGMVLIVRAHEDSVALEDGQWGYPLPLPLSTFWGPKLAAAGANTFHLVTTADQRVLYLHYANDAWSSPLELGRTDVRPGNASGALDVASDAGPEAVSEKQTSQCLLDAHQKTPWRKLDALCVPWFTQPVWEALKHASAKHLVLNLSDTFRLALFNFLKANDLMTPELYEDPTWFSLREKGLV